MTALLDVLDLRVAFGEGQKRAVVVDGVSLSVGEGEVLGLVGESGCGKSMTLRAILGLLPPRASVVDGQIWFRGQDLTALDQRSLTRLRGRGIGMVFQEPMTALNPVMKVGDQISEGLRVDQGWGKQKARQRAVELMQMVGIPDAVRRVDAYPHELSGGLRQRVMIAMAVSREAPLMLCDEPTTALDVTIQEQILQLLLSLRARMGTALVLVTHDLAVVAETCERVAVMYAGQLVETGSVAAVFDRPSHPYTVGLLRSVPDIALVRGALESIPGTPPDLSSPPVGCRFHPRCRLADDACMSGEFPLRTISEGRGSSCIHFDRLMEG